MIISSRADLNLVPGIGYLLMVMLIMAAFQWYHDGIALPVSANADLHPPAPSEIVLRVPASDRMVLTIDDEWGTHGHWGYYRQLQSREELERELRRLLADSTENRVLTLRADSTLRFGTVEQVVMAAREADVRVIRLVVETK